MKDRIKQLRKELGLSQQTFADRIKSKRSTIATYETGRNPLSDTVIELICREFNVNEQWLRTGDGDMFKPDSQTEIQILAEKYHLDESSKAMIQRFIELPPEDRQAVIRYAESLAEAFIKKNSSQPSPQEDKEEQYKKELSGTASTEASSASSTTAATASD